MRRLSISLIATAGGLAVSASSLGLPASAAADTWRGISTNRAIQGNQPQLRPLDALVPSAGPAITGTGHAAAISPDGQTAWVVGVTDTVSTIRRVDLGAAPIVAQVPVQVGGPAEFVCGSTYKFNFGATAIALTPAGTKAYVTSSSDNAVYPVDLTTATPTVGAAIPLAAGSRPVGIAIDPLGDTAYVVGQASGTVTPISLGAGSAGAGVPIALTAGSKPSAIAITPDGKQAYVAVSNRAAVVPITLSTLTVGAEIPTGAGTSPSGVAITADGTRAYVTNGGGENPCPGATAGNTSVTPVDTAARAALPNFTVSGSQVKPVSPALTPDGKRLFVAPFVNADGPPTTTTIVRDLVANSNASLQTGFATTGLAIAADQAPTASFTRTGTLAGAPVSFDGSGSSTPVGTIAKYDWDFGDGAKATTAGPTTSHTYLTPGEQTATLTVTNSAGTSTERVFTGQMVRRNGGPSASTTRAFSVVAGGVAVARLAPASVDFGNVLPGATGDRQATVTNAGDAPLTFTSAAIYGAGAADFSVTGGTCTGARLDPGASCVVGLRFAPTAPNARSEAAAVITTDAPDPVQRLSLVGTSSTVATVRGSVLNGSAANAAVPGASITLCPEAAPAGPAACVGTTTDAAGGYELGGRTAGRYRLAVSPPAGSRLGAATVHVSLTSGAATTQNVVVEDPRAFPAGFEVSGGDGTTVGGRPNVSIHEPFSIRFPAEIAPSGVPGSTRLHLYLVQLGEDGGAAGDPPAALIDLVAFQVHYGDDGQVDAMSQVLEATGGSLASATGETSSLATRSGVEAFARRLQAGAGSGGCGPSGFTITPSAGGGIQLNIDWVDGPVSLTLDPVSFPPPKTGSAAGDLIAGQLVSLATAPVLAASPVAGYNTALRIANAGLYVRDGRYAAGARQLAINILFPAIKKRLPKHSNAMHGQAQAQIWKIFTKGFTDSTAGTITPPPVAPGELPGQGTSCSRQTGNMYIDPSGNVVTKKGGVPLEKADVVLQRSDAAAGPFAQVPDGSTIMSPGNRKNPDLTDVAGHFGWDVIPGFYRVDASLKGCKSRISSRIMEIPPPVTDLLLPLDCKAPKRMKATVSATRVGPAKGRSVLVATVKPKSKSKGAVVGVVTFRRGKTVLGEAVIGRRGTASLPVDLSRSKGQLKVSYGGSARHAPGSATVR